MTCPHCATPVLPDAEVCPVCGSPLPPPAEPAGTPGPAALAAYPPPPLPPPGYVPPSSGYVPPAGNYAGPPGPAAPNPYATPPPPAGYTPPGYAPPGWVPPPGPAAYSPPPSYPAAYPAAYPYGPASTAPRRGNPALLWIGISLVVLSLIVCSCAGLAVVGAGADTSSSAQDIRDTQLGALICAVGVFFVLGVPGAIMFFFGVRR